MGKAASDDCLDQLLNWIKNNGDKLCLCNAEPTTFTQATSTYKLADVDVSSSDFGTPEAGDVSGRKMAVLAQGNVNVDTTGTGTHMALVSYYQLLYVTTLGSSVSVTSGNKVNFSEWEIEFTDPT